MRQLPSINSLITFVTLAKVQSVTKAANELCISPSAVSDRIRRIETILEVKLFNNPGFELSSTGARYLDAVSESLYLLDNWSEDMTA